MWIILSGDHITCQRAYEIGFIQAVVPDRDALFAEAERRAGILKLCAPLAVQALQRFHNPVIKYNHHVATKLTSLSIKDNVTEGLMFIPQLLYKVANGGTFLYRLLQNEGSHPLAVKNLTNPR